MKKTHKEEPKIDEKKIHKEEPKIDEKKTHKEEPKKIDLWKTFINLS